MTRFLLSVLGLTGIYSMFLLSAHAWDLAIGAVIAMGVVAIFRRHLFGNALQPLTGLGKRSVALLRFAWFIYVDVVQGIRTVLSIVLGLRPLARSGILTIPIGERTPTGVAVTGWAASLSPGSVLIDVDWERRMMLFHFIDVTEPEKLKEKMQTLYDRYQRPVFP